MTRPDLKNFKAVIFDLDGVLIDSMPHHVAAWQEIFRGFGVELPSEDLRLHEGEKAKVTIGKLARQHGLSFSDDQLEELVERKRQVYRQQAPRGLRPIARQTVEQCRRLRFKTAIVTGSVRPNVEWTLSPEELGLFDVIITSEECVHGKPHPEPFQRAADALRARPQDCLVIENAPLGIRSAKAAGMICIAIATTLARNVLREADWITDDLDDLWDENED